MKHSSAQVEDEAYPTLWDWVNAQPRTRTFKSLAKICGCTPSQFSEYVWGRRKPGNDMALRIHERTGIALKGLIEGEPFRKRTSRAPAQAPLSSVELTKA